MDALEVADLLLGHGELRGKGFGDVEGKWCGAGVLECHGVEGRDGNRASLDRFKETPRLDPWKSTVKYICSKLLENPTSTVADTVNTLGGIFRENLLNKNSPFSDCFHFACI